MKSVAEIIEACDAIFQDTSCSPEETRDKLEQIADHVGASIAALNNDIGDRD